MGVLLKYFRTKQKLSPLASGLLATYMSSFFCDVTQSCSVFSQPSFVTASRSHLQGSKCPQSVIMDCGQQDNAA